MTTGSDWRRIDAALDEILDLPPAERAAACARIAGTDASLRSELESLLAHVDREDPVLDFPAGHRKTETEADVDQIRERTAVGTRVGVYRIVQLLGRGGMGEVYRAERDDGQFEQQVAIKLMRPGFVDRSHRFHAERRILARLEHPNIAGLHDGGVAEDGRLYMIMELVDGQPITQYCRDRRCTLTRRLQLFLSVCEAVAYAHRKLVVHRDLKPSNVFVTQEGAVKLLDFGVARLLDQTPRDETRFAAMTPGYAAPEQLTGGQITTATDVFSLGVLLFELLSGENPWGTEELPLAALVDRVLEHNTPVASKFAQANADPPVPAKSIRGDLDAIIAKAMRKEPESRYETVAQLQSDVIRTLRSEPVSAREGARWYVAGRFLKRHRWGVAAATVLSVAVFAAAAAVTWQGHIARQEAARASAVKDFLLQVFRASDPRIASDKPRGQITAKELLDLSIGRIDREFAAQPELHLELLGMTSDIYGYLGDDDRSDELLKKRVALARSLYGEYHPIVIDGMITSAWGSIYGQDFATANRLLARSDELLHGAGLDESKVRAGWWIAKERALQATPGTAVARRDALNRAIALYAKYDPHGSYYSAALANAATMRFLNAEYQEAADLNDRAIKISETSPDRNDMDLAVMYGNYGDALSKLGRGVDAENAYDKSESLTLRTTGAHFGTYWRTLASHAALLYLRGDRDRAMTTFANMLAAIPADWKANTDDVLARQEYADILTRDGRAVEAGPLLEDALRVLTKRPRHDYDLRHVQQELGDVYDVEGRIDAARAAFEWAMHDYDANEPKTNPGVLESRERWARFLLEHPRGAQDVTDALAALKRVLSDGIPTSRYTPAMALAHADMAMRELRDGNAATALTELGKAETALGKIKSIYDVRIADDVELLRAEVLAALHRLPEARAAVVLALQAAQRHNAPQSLRVSRANSQRVRIEEALAT